MIKCKECGTPQQDGTLFCNECGSYLLETAVQSTVMLPFSDTAHHVAPPPISKFEPEPLSNPLPLTFIIPSHRRRIQIDLIDQIRIGRADPQSNILPDLNLMDDNGDMGVSRVHAAIRSTKQGLTIVDLGSTNGTFLNNAPLSPQSAYPLKNGDEIRFGDLLVHVLFQTT
jgi:hypothetical protein